MSPPTCTIHYYRNGEWVTGEPMEERYTTGATIRQSTENRYYAVVGPEGLVARLIPCTADADFMQFMRDHLKRQSAA